MGGRGWCWIPGTTWGPAWVNWRWGGGYVGWAPMAPARRRRRAAARCALAVALHRRRSARRARARTFCRRARWRRCGTRTSPIHNVSNVSIRGTQVRFNAGPPARLVAAATGRAIAPTPLRTVAPRALPSQAIAPRVGMPLQQRPWMQGRAAVGTTSRQRQLADDAHARRAAVHAAPGDDAAGAAGR